MNKNKKDDRSKSKNRGQNINISKIWSKDIRDKY